MSQNPDLRHVTSNSALVSPARDHRRTSQHLRTVDPRLGSRSPSSIPSSPTSIHSSSSAIFERDIEPIIPPSPPGAHHITHPAHPSNPHRIPRAKGTEALEQAVPSVLDSAATVLSSLDPSDLDFSDQVSVVAPIASASASFVVGGGVPGSGFASPIGSFRSRSPSPHGSRITSPTSILGLHNVSPPQPPHALLPPPSSSPPRPALMTVTPVVDDADHPPALGTNDQDVEHEIRLSEPTQATLSASPSSQLSPTSPTSTSPVTGPTPSLSPSSHPPSPLHLPKKRLSFMSYADLLSSTPSSMQPLANLTVGASSAEPPPHIPGVSGLNIVSALYAQGVDVAGGAQMPPPPVSLDGALPSKSATPSLRSISLGLSLPLNALGLPLPTSASSSPPQTQVLLGPQGGVTHPHKRDSIAMLDNLGGEWEREGLGRGMEERLEMIDVIEGVAGKGSAVVNAEDAETKETVETAAKAGNV